MGFVRAFASGSKDERDLLGGKGANLAEMTNLGLPVPPGFTDHHRGVSRLPSRRGLTRRASPTRSRSTWPRWRRRWAAGSARPTTRSW